MSSIFVSYRRNPHGTTVAAIADGLQRYFGTEEVFIDNRIPFGDHYPAALEDRLRACTVLVAVIHEGWETTFDEPRHKDWVLHEIKTALDRKIHVIPVPIGAAAMPGPEKLPREIDRLALRQAAPIRPASYAVDLDNLIHQLERHVAPATEPPEHVESRAKRTWLRLLAGPASIFALTLALFYSPGTWWELFARTAAISTATLGLVSILTTVLVCTVRPLTDRWERGSGRRGIREMFSRYWIVPALIAFASVTTSIRSMDQDGGLHGWNAYYLIALFLIAFWILSFWFRRAAELDEQWPPPVTTEHVVFRRAAYRLEQRLTDDKKLRNYRTKADRQDAKLILSRLDDAREQLDHRAGTSITAWVGNGYRREVTAYLSWFTSIVALDFAATGVSVFGEPAPEHSLRAAGLTIAVAAAFTAAAVFVNHRLDRRNARRWSAELTEWRRKLAPMIHEHEAPAEPGFE